MVVRIGVNQYVKIRIIFITFCARLNLRMEVCMEKNKWKYESDKGLVLFSLWVPVPYSGDFYCINKFCFLPSAVLSLAGTIYIY